jgi:DNA modification methylase
MDIFAGSGTTLRVAEDLGRLWFGIDLSDEYLKLIKTRTGQRTVLGLTGRMAVKKNMSRK